MFKFQSDLSKLLNRYINKKHQFGQNDCNILVADYIDMLYGTDYVSKMKDQYSDIVEGLRLCKKLVGFNNVLEACEKHLEQSETIETGSVILIKQKHGRRIYYSASIVINEKVITVHDDVYQVMNIKDVDYELIYNRRK
ncbi:hypothetical protein K1J20_02470 [Enterobacter hormaechei]|uniref:DUF6950 family protein n=1 Tax=Enterobacter TaxID=547 RepID=UPI0007351B7A|nr:MULTISPECIES: hypothetical protein [Enterobacter cloacae complex]KAA0856714.1 hypothetical protein EYC85_08280 [Enterobacter hormaechei]KAA0870041.1 hypothetical protein EYC91_09010 [Enterobacter hormaechei]KAA0902193.1 hypothetical protein EVS72_13170 [Enterobacter hormaechei]KAA0905215.1 hypothetical protein EYC88_17365 [Enterobacter hormaechei]KTH83733.1 hypothetical protein ASV15_23360 [Enterobacter hormaechei subsp. steigerwaltii]